MTRRYDTAPEKQSKESKDEPKTVVITENQLIMNYLETVLNNQQVIIDSIKKVYDTITLTPKD